MIFLVIFIALTVKYTAPQNSLFRVDIQFRISPLQFSYFKDYIVRSHGGLVMSPSESPTHQASIDRFWGNYLFILENISIPKTSIPWYR